MSDTFEIPETVTIDGDALHEAAFLLERLVELLDNTIEPADAFCELLAGRPRPDDVSTWVAALAGHLRHRLLGVPR